MMYSIRIITKEGTREYALDASPERTILDALEIIRSGGEQRLHYRHSCHHGSCGTCGAIINGKPRLMCLTRLGNLSTRTIVLEPLSKVEALDGVAVFPGQFFDSLPDTDYLKNTDGSAAAIGLDMPEIRYRDVPELDVKPKRLEDCIECGLCASACPVSKDFIGPAACAHIHIETVKHPETSHALLARAFESDGAPACKRAFECSRVCPQGVAPGKHITALLMTKQMRGTGH